MSNARNLADLSVSVTNDGSVTANALTYTGALTGSTGVLNIGSGQIYKSNTGLIGIGTTSPGQILDIVSGSTGGTNINLNNGNAVTTFYNIYSVGSFTTGFNNSGSTINNLPSGVCGHWMQQSYPMIFATAGSERMRLDSSGNVGIGTSSPFAKLSVEKTGGDLISVRYNNANARLGLSVGATSGAGFLGSNLVHSSGNIFNFDRTGLAWWIGQPAGQAYLTIGINSGTSGTSAGTDTSTYDKVCINASGNVSIGATSTSGYKFLVQGINADCARFVASSGRADLTLTSSGVISYDIGTNTDASFSVRQNGTYDFLRLYNNGNIGVGYAAGSSITTGTANIIIGRGAGQFVTTSNNNIVMGDYVTGTNYSYVSTVSSAKQTIIGDSISEIVYPTYTSFNGTYTIYDFALNSTVGGLYEISSVVNTNGGGSGYYRCYQHSYVGCRVDWGGNGYGVYLTNGSLYNHNGTNVNAIVIYNSNNNTEYVGSLYISGSNYLWDTSGIYLRVKLTNFNTTPQYIGAQKVILRKKIIGN